MENIPNPTSTPDEDFLEVDDSTKQYFQKTLEKTVTPLREQLSREQSERVAQQNLARNNEVIASAIWRNNWVLSLRVKKKALLIRSALFTQIKILVKRY